SRLDEIEKDALRRIEAPPLLLVTDKVGTSLVQGLKRLIQICGREAEVGLFPRSPDVSDRVACSASHEVEGDPSGLGLVRLEQIVHPDHDEGDARSSEGSADWPAVGL